MASLAVTQCLDIIRGITLYGGARYYASSSEASRDRALVPLVKAICHVSNIKYASEQLPRRLYTCTAAYPTSVCMSVFSLPLTTTRAMRYVRIYTWSRETRIPPPLSPCPAVISISARAGARYRLRNKFIPRVQDEVYVWKGN